MSSTNKTAVEQENSDYLNTSEMLLYMHNNRIDGNIVDHTWYKIIKWKYSNKNPDGKPHREAIELLADIFYWYRPTVEKDEKGNVTIKKKFHADMLQRSYHDLEESLGLTKDEAQSAFKTLEGLGIAKREFRTIVSKGIKIANVLYVRFDPIRLKELTDEYFKKVMGLSVQKDDPPCLNVTPQTFERMTNTETTSNTSTQTCKNNVSVAPFSPKKKQSPPEKKPVPKVNLEPEQQALHDRLVKTLPEWGNKLDSRAVSYWLVQWGCDRVKQVLELYYERVKEAKERNGTVTDMGAMMRDALNKDLKPKREDFYQNQAFANENPSPYAKITKLYLNVKSGIYTTDLQFSWPHKTFKTTFYKAMEMCEEYAF